MTMNIVKVKNLFKVASQSHQGVWYVVDLEKKTCTCPEFLYRMKRIGGICKHINAVEEKEERKVIPTVMTKKIKEKIEKEKRDQAKSKAKEDEKKKKYEEIIAFVRLRGSVATIDLINKYGEESVEDLLRLGELIEKQGKVYLIE